MKRERRLEPTATPANPAERDATDRRQRLIRFVATAADDNVLLQKMLETFGDEQSPVSIGAANRPRQLRGPRHLKLAHCARSHRGVAVPVGRRVSRMVAATTDQERAAWPRHPGGRTRR
jgi:hypothetical protein